jgi:geranylgeranyl diphosphate synthase type 3
VLINILKQKTNDDDVKRYAVSYMEGTGSFAYTRRVLRGLTRKALALVDEVDRNSGLEARGGGIRAILDRLRVDKQRDRASMAEISEDRER